MKYIRTKDGIYTLIAKEPIYELNGKKYYCVEEQISSFSEEDVIKQANTIEELCDEFVYVASEKDRPIICYKPSVFHKLSDNLYGAIWTDKGLIYVAKMNDKGELELLWASFN